MPLRPPPWPPRCPAGPDSDSSDPDCLQASTLLSVHAYLGWGVVVNVLGAGALPVISSYFCHKPVKGAVVPFST